MRRATVVVIDDEPAYGAVMTEILSAYGLEAHLASDALEAIALLQQVTPDVILLDIMMPEMDGIMLMRLLRSDPSWPRVPIIVISAKAMPEDRRAAVASGADTFLAKPFTAQELHAVLRRFVPIQSTGPLGAGLCA